MDNNELKEELSDIKKEIKALAKVFIQYQVMEQKLIQLEQKRASDNLRHDEGRKVIHKRMDVYAKIGFWFFTTIFVAMAGTIWELLNRVIH